jgi:hypothetical protein
MEWASEWVRSVHSLYVLTVIYSICRAYNNLLRVVKQYTVVILSDNYRLPLSAYSFLLLTQPTHSAAQTHDGVAAGSDNLRPPVHRREIRLRTCNFVCTKLVRLYFVTCSQHRKIFWRRIAYIKAKEWNRILWMGTVSMANCLHKNQYMSIMFFERGRCS